jgi:hypothetical protein
MNRAEEVAEHADLSVRLNSERRGERGSRGKGGQVTRVAVLEQEVADLKSKLARSLLSEVPWWDRIAGTFANDPPHDEAMKAFP